MTEVFVANTLWEQFGLSLDYSLPAEKVKEAIEAHNLVSYYLLFNPEERQDFKYFDILAKAEQCIEAA